MDFLQRVRELLTPSGEQPVVEQAVAFDSLPPVRKGFIIALPDCDEIPGVSGRFGECDTNPIPVNGPLGERIYLSRLRGKSGVGFMWHRVGTARSPVYPYPLDVYEIVAVDASEWRTLYFAMYHRRRSTKTPSGLSLLSWRGMTEVERVYSKTGFPGSDQLVEDFPLGLPSVIVHNDTLNDISPGLGNTMAQLVEKWINASSGKWKRPKGADHNCSGG